jgi:hypothetical protein
MNFGPKFEQYRKDEEKLEKIPTIRPEFHFVLNDAAKKVLSSQELTEKEVGDLEIVYDLAQDLERELIGMVDRHRSQGALSKNESLITADYFLTAHQNGPDSAKLKEHVVAAVAAVEDFEAAARAISIPEHTRALLIEAYRKIRGVS